MKITCTVALLAALLPFAADAGERSEVGQDLDQARKELRAELAQERAKLYAGNLALGDTLHFGPGKHAVDRKVADLPKGEITPAGDLLISGKPIPVDAGQRRRLLAYRTQVIDVAKDGIDAGEKAALMALDVTDVSIFQLIVGGLSGSLERRVHATVERELKPAILQICRRLPALQASQQALAADVPAFRPYATLRDEDVAGCEADVQRDFATR